MSDDRERIAVLEANQKRLQEDIKDVLEVFRIHMKNEDDRWEAVQNHMAKQKGFIGGIILAVSSVWAIVVAGLQFWGK